MDTLCVVRSKGSIRAVLSAVIASLLTGCTSAQPRIRQADSSAAVGQVQTRLNEIIDAAEKKDFPRLDSYHLYGPKFTKFAAETFGRLDALAAREGEHTGLAAVSGMSMKPADLKIDVFDEVAVVTFILNYSFKAEAQTVQRTARATMVLVKTAAGWQITHEHFSTIPVR